jgi:hypothetical protein
MTQNERDIIAVLQYSISTKTPPDRIADAMTRLLAQLPQPSASKSEAEAERERIMKEAREKAPGPPNPVNKGLVMPLPSPEELAERERYQQRLAEHAEKMKQPLAKRVM